MVVTEKPWYFWARTRAAGAENVQVTSVDGKSSRDAAKLQKPKTGLSFLACRSKPARHYPQQQDDSTVRMRLGGALSGRGRRIYKAGGCAGILGLGCRRLGLTLPSNLDCLVTSRSTKATRVHALAISRNASLSF
jgi:hypothetical protein